MWAVVTKAVTAAQVASKLTRAMVGGKLFPRTAAEIAGGITPTDYGYEPGDVRRYGVLDDGVTDSTAALLTACNAIKGAFRIPPNVLYDRKTLLVTLDPAVVLLDLSVINDYSAPGETTKRVGVISADTAPSDTHWAVDSGHHAVLTTNNYGSSGSASAAARRASWLWAVGKFVLGAANKQGWRGAAMAQWAQSPGNSFWVWHLRSMAPWSAIDAEYELWDTGQVIGGAGVYRASSVGHYVSTGAGTTGATEPVHTSGTVSDGGVNWTYVDSTDRTVYTIDEYGRVLIGSGAGTNTFEHKVSATDPGGGGYSGRYAARGVSKAAQLQLVPTDGASAEAAQPYVRAEAGVGLRLMKSSGATDVARVTDVAFATRGLVTLSATAASGDATPSVLDVSTLYLTNAAATNLTALDDGLDDQLVTLIATDANTTLVHSATLMLTGSANLALTAWSSVTFKKVPAVISNRWVEVARSVK